MADLNEVLTNIAVYMKHQNAVNEITKERMGNLYERQEFIFKVSLIAILLSSCHFIIEFFK
jgi:hypothetical protein